MMSHKDLVAELGRGRVFVHCARIEGHSRLGFEARLMGTCCVGLASNRFAVGFDEAAGGALVQQPEDVLAVLQQILSDADNLRSRRGRARAQALSETSWESYVERVGNAIAAVEAEPQRRDVTWRQVAAELALRETKLEQKVAALSGRRSLRTVDALKRLLHSRFGLWRGRNQRSDQI
jgi:hypothetical protein